MNPNSKHNTQQALGKARRSALTPKAPLTPIKIFPTKLFGYNASPFRGVLNLPADNKENIPPSMDPHGETCRGTLEYTAVARPPREAFTAKKMRRFLGLQAGSEPRKPLRELSQAEVNARSMQASSIASRTVFIVASEGEQNAEHEGFGEGSFRTVLSARSEARSRQPKTATHSPFLIFVD